MLLFVHLSSFSSTFSQNQWWTKLAILWEVYSDWFAVSRNSSQNSARTWRNVRNDKCIAGVIVCSTRECQNVRSVIAYICISVQVWFLKNRHFRKIKSSVISNLDGRIRNYLGNYCRNDANQPTHLLTRLVRVAMCEKLQFPYPLCSHTRTYVSAFSRWTFYRH